MESRKPLYGCGLEDPAWRQRLAPGKAGPRGPCPPRAGSPAPAAGLPPALGSAAAAPRAPGCPGPRPPRQPAGSPRRTFHIRKRPYKSRFRRRLPDPYMVIPAPGRGGRGEPGRESQVAAGPRARPPPGRGSARLLAGQAARGARGAPGRLPRRRGQRSRSPPPPAPVRSARPTRLPPVSAEGPPARRARCGGVLREPAARLGRRLPALGEGESRGL